MIDLFDYIIDLLIEFDEMGFVPTNHPHDHNSEYYSVAWKNRLINALEGYRKQSECDKCGEKAMKTIVSLQEALAQAKSEWISVDERLPDREGTYLVCTYKGARKFGVYGRYFVCDEPKFEYDVTHWMPLPEPPKMKGGAE